MIVPGSRLPPVGRLLRHVPGTIEGLTQNGAHTFASRHALVHYGSGSVFTFIPKNACTSLRVSLALANSCIADVAQWTWIHKNNSTFSATLPDLLRAPTTGVILRCPFRRLASTFLDKIVSRGREFWDLHRLSRDIISPDTFTFRDFVGWLGRGGFLRADIHWRPQVDFLVYESYDAVFTVDRLADFAEFFATHTGSAFADSRAYSGHVTADFAFLDAGSYADTPLAELTWKKSKGFLPRPSDLFDSTLIARVRQLYAADFQLYRSFFGEDGLMFSDRYFEGETLLNNQI